MSEKFSFRYEPRFMEEAVFFSQRNSQAPGDLGQQRNGIYEIADSEERERLFEKLYEAWFVRLGLGAANRTGLSGATAHSFRNQNLPHRSGHESGR